MSASRRGSSSRRSFLKTLPAAVAGTVAAPALAQSQTPATTEAITSDALAVAQQIVGVELPAAEREIARVLVARNRDNIEQLRRVAIPSNTEPAFSFRPPRPPITSTNGRPTTVKSRSRSNAKSSVAPASRPTSLEQLALAPVTHLSSLVSSRQISSTELTAMYLTRLKRYDPTLLVSSHCSKSTRLLKPRRPIAKSGPAGIAARFMAFLTESRICLRFEVYRNAGATLIPIKLPDLPAAAIYALLNAEAGAMFDELTRSGGINELADKGTNGRANQLRVALHPRR
jgi:hypothetical protein